MVRSADKCFLRIHQPLQLRPSFRGFPAIVNLRVIEIDQQCAVCERIVGLDVITHGGF